ncbi:flagellar basal body rod protein FlgB [Gracilibacillus halophilus YIM-C55.5]|uniref:Flagellar basal body rod protein FlgB n=1 Tax=Gracilibacillus halophilus YIM-C55.5 TaxID=1308866 RepID=N4WV51_9BACI|nr:flagellar basal body rod protein FlgB [Gracilibacillus halophilus]ENH98245.1 flagellar basal body rod protein FlgB [Gracilibacillus halophilus YIM-C55.5]
MSFFGNTIQTLEQSMDYASLKNRTISNNISNVDTPNYKAKQVQFQDVLNNEMNTSFQSKQTNPRHLAFGQSNENSFRVTTDQSTQYNHNGNNVDIDKEMSELAKNQIYYQALTNRINGKFNSLQSVIRGGN